MPGPSVVARPAIGLPEGATASLYENPFTDDTRDGYLVSLYGELATDGTTGPFDGRPWVAKETDFAPKRGFQLSVVAYTTVPGQYEPPRWDPGIGYTDSRQAGDPCVFVAAGSCGWRTAFDPGVALDVTFQTHRYSTRDYNWIGARLTGAAVSQSAIDRYMQRITISGKPVDVPQVFALTTKETAPQRVLDMWYRLNNCERLPPESDCWAPRTLWALGNDTLSPDVLLAFQEVAEDRSPMSLPAWSAWTESVNDIAAGNPPVGTHCSRLRDGRIIGLVTTNATLYSPGPPKLVDGALTYKVAGLHYVADGSVFRGTYDLVMDGEYVRCLYQLTKAPLSATIEITSSDGSDEQVAATVVREKDGLLYLRATGFTFSDPTISVRILGQKAKVTTIRCKKGTQIKKITGISPQCPKGWKRI